MTPAPSAPEVDVAPLSGDDWLDVICPYLRSADGTWRAATPVRDHRCWAMDPATEIPFLTQQRLCLTSSHGGCERFAHAQARRVAALARDRIAPDLVEGARFGPFTSGVPLAVEPESRPQVALEPVTEAPPPLRRPSLPVVAFGSAASVVVVIVLTVILFGGGGSNPVPTPPAGPGGSFDAAGGVDATSRPRTARPGRTSAPRSFRRYVIREGDTLRLIARRFDISVKRLRDANNLGQPPVLPPPGRAIRIPVDTRSTD
jgi:LysM repeat protein